MKKNQKDSDDRKLTSNLANFCESNIFDQKSSNSIDIVKNLPEVLCFNVKLTDFSIFVS